MLDYQWRHFVSLGDAQAIAGEPLSQCLVCMALVLDIARGMHVEWHVTHGHIVE